jgi:DNA-binding NarL/FixJ family response regulator
MGFNIKILLVDDNRTFLSAVRNFLTLVPDVEVVAEAYDGAMALEQAARHRPDLVLMDIAMPGMSGLEAASAMNSFAPPPSYCFSVDARRCLLPRRRPGPGGLGLCG